MNNYIGFQSNLWVSFLSQVCTYNMQNIQTVITSILEVLLSKQATCTAETTKETSFTDIIDCNWKAATSLDEKNKKILISD